MSDLLDLIRDLEPAVTHVLMPNMAYACGRNMLDHGGRFQTGINDWPAITCPECSTLDPDELRTEIRAQQGRQADVA